MSIADCECSGSSADVFCPVCAYSGFGWFDALMDNLRAELAKRSNDEIKAFISGGLSAAQDIDKKQEQNDE